MTGIKNRLIALAAGTTAALFAGIAVAQMQPRPGMGPGMGMMQHGMGMGMGMGNPVRHRIIMMGPGVPAPYKGMKNPLPDTPENVAAGKKIYLEQCFTCHGPTGAGDGVAGKDLDPKPANLAFIIDKPIATDDFLMWSMSEGGEPLGTAMPAFKELLSEKERWQVVLYLREGLGKKG